MDKMDELLTLMDLDKALTPRKYDALNLNSLIDLRIEVKRRINKLKRS